MQEQRKWEDLGIDCLANVFSRLDLEDLILSAPFVCKPWFEASMDHQCWKVLDLRNIDVMPWSSFRAQFKQVYKTSERFSFTRFMKTLVNRSHGSTLELALPTDRFASLQELEYASINCPRLKVLSLPNLFHHDDKQLPRLIEKWKDLEYLKMERKPASFSEMVEQIGFNCNNFIGLQLMSSCVEYDDALAIVKHLPKLECLVMSGSSLSKSVVLAILDGCKQLRVLDVSNCTGFHVDEEILKMASCIKIFYCEGSKLEEEQHTDYCDGDDVYWGMIC